MKIFDKMAYHIERVLHCFPRRAKIQLGRIEKGWSIVHRKVYDYPKSWKEKQIWCFGDSNTYGYDPQGLFGGRYAKSWPEILKEETGLQIINDGMNGRSIPCTEYEFSEFRRKTARYNADLLIVMLGTNDLLNGASASDAAKQMKAFIAECGVKSILLIAPPTMKRGAWVTGDAVVVQSLELSQQYRRLAEEVGILFADAGEWEIEIAFDGVHFTEEGHARFADKLAEVLRKSLT